MMQRRDLLLSFREKTNGHTLTAEPKQYRAFIAKSITPRFAFGYGLTYTNFTYTSLQISLNPAVNTAAFPPDAANPHPPQGGLASLYDIISTVSATVTNSGPFAAAEVAQLYMGIQDSGQEKALRGFEKKLLQPGRSEVFSFPLRRKDLSVWGTGAQQWKLPGGTFMNYVGKSVLDVQLQGELRL
jgi:beta-glucosidase